MCMWPKWGKFNNVQQKEEAKDIHHTVHNLSNSKV